jgi:hypothetical protein
MERKLGNTDLEAKIHGGTDITTVQVMLVPTKN